MGKKQKNLSLLKSRWRKQLLKPDKMLSFYVLNGKEKLATIYAQQLNKLKLNKK